MANYIMMEPTETLLTCSNTSLIGSLIGSSRNTGNIDAKDIQSVARIDTPTITIVGHSGTNLFSSNRNLADLDPKKLAQLIIKKYKGDRNLLKDINLISCEAGMLINGRCFAQEFLKEMQNLGFNNLQVHAMSHPNSMKITSMYVETSQKFYQDTAKQEMTVSSFCYKSDNDEKRDKQIESEMKNSPGETKRQLLQERATIRIYTCTELRYNEALSLPQNTFSGPHQTPQAVMSNEVVAAINFLKSKYDQLDVKEKSGNYGLHIKGVIQKLQKRPNASLDDIDRIIMEEVSLGDEMNKMVTKLGDDLKNYIHPKKSQQVTIAIECLKNESARHQKDKKIYDSGRYEKFLIACLNNLNYWENRNFNSEEIQRLMKSQIPSISGNKPKYEDLIKSIMAKISDGAKEEVKVTGQFSTTSKLQEYPSLESQNAPIPTQNASSDYSLSSILRSIYKSILNISYRKPSAEFQDKIKALDESIKQYENHRNSDNSNKKQSALEAVKTILLKDINSYLETHTDETSQQNKQKIELMKLMKEYLEGGKITAGPKLNAITLYVNENKSNTLWDKGFRSRVKLIKAEVDMLAKTIGHQSDSQEVNDSPKL